MSEDTVVKPAQIKFGSESGPADRLPPTVSRLHAASAPDIDLEDDEDDPDEEEIVAPKGKSSGKKNTVKRKGGVPPIVLITIGVMFTAIVVGGGAIVIKKRNAAAEQGEMHVVPESPQPVIQESLPPAPQTPMQAAPAAYVDSAPALTPTDIVTVPPTAGAVQAGPAPVQSAQPLAPPVVQAPVPAIASAPAPASAPVEVRYADPKDSAKAQQALSASESALKEVAGLKQVMTTMLKRLDRIEAELKARPAAAASIAAAPVQPRPMAPSAVKRQRQAPVVAAREPQLSRAKAVPIEQSIAPDEVIVEVAPNRDYWIAGIVNNRAFVVRRGVDGTEVEQSVVVGESVDGRRVIAIDAASKVITLADGQRITTARNR